jgi:hypothetical protein
MFGECKGGMLTMEKTLLSSSALVTHVKHAYAIETDNPSV